MLNANNMLDQIVKIDTQIFRAINNFHFKALDFLMYLVSLIGELAIVWFAAGLLILYKNKKDGKKILVLLTVAILLTLVVNHIVIAYFISRSRPYIELLDVHQLGKQWKDSSFPSGHVSSAVASTVILGKYYKKWILPMILLIVLTMYSRVYLGMHYPGDVLGGVLVGLVCGWVTLGLYRILFNKEK